MISDECKTLFSLKMPNICYYRPFGSIMLTQHNKGKKMSHLRTSDTRSLKLFIFAMGTVSKADIEDSPV